MTPPPAVVPVAVVPVAVVPVEVVPVALVLLVLALLVVALVVLALVVLATLGRVRRLHRLHQRLDAARAALDAALARRAQAARAAGVGGPADAALARAGRPWDGDREEVENALGAALGRLDRGGLVPPVRDELADAEQLAALGRILHNDAVRDALALRRRRLVRWFRLAGTAPVPVYAEFAVTRIAAGERRADVRSSSTRPPRKDPPWRPPSPPYPSSPLPARAGPAPPAPPASSAAWPRC